MTYNVLSATLSLHTTTTTSCPDIEVNHTNKPATCIMCVNYLLTSDNHDDFSCVVVLNTMLNKLIGYQVQAWILVKSNICQIHSSTKC